MSTKLEMPDYLPPLPPVPEGYDRWEYRGMGWEAESVKYVVYQEGDLEWFGAGEPVSNAYGMGDVHYTEAVKDDPGTFRLTDEPKMVEFCGGNGKHTGMHDMVNSPPHYQGDGIECIDAIKAALTPEEFRGYVKGNALKYVWRERNKGGDQDLEKATWYLNRLKKEKP